MAGTLGRGGGGSRIIAQINVTPLVDVVLVLLVVLMVSSTYIVAQALKIQLPRAQTSDGAVDRSVAVTVMVDGSLLWNDAPMKESELEARLRSEAQANPELSLVVAADKNAAHGRVVRVIDVARSVGIESFAINIESE